MIHRAPLAVLLVGLALPLPAHAGPIETACRASDRPGASWALCRCIDSVADQMLTRAEQRRVARFFRDPDLAQQVRASNNATDSAFWQRYRAFGERAEASCTR